MRKYKFGLTLHNFYFELCAFIEQINIFFVQLCLMEMESNLVLNQIGFKFFVKMIGVGGFKNS